MTQSLIKELELAAVQADTVGTERVALTLGSITVAEAAFAACSRDGTGKD